VGRKETSSFRHRRERGDGKGEGVSELKAGPELDAMIAEKVMGWEPLPIIHTDDFGPKSRAYRVPINGREKHGVITCQIAAYSTNIADAWQVVEKMREKGWHITLTDSPPKGQEILFFQSENPVRAAPAPCLAICLAALRAVGAIT